MINRSLYILVLSCFIPLSALAQGFEINIEDLHKVKEISESYSYTGDSIFICLRSYNSCIKVNFTDVNYDLNNNLLRLSGFITDCFDSSRIIGNSLILVGEFIVNPKNEVCGARIRIHNKFKADDKGVFTISFTPKQKESLCFTFAPEVINSELYFESGRAEIYYIHKLFR